MNDLYLIFVPEINPDTFLLFNLQDRSSFSIRHYPNGIPNIKRTKDLPDYTGIQILNMAHAVPDRCIRQIEAPKVEGNDRYWERKIRDANSRLLPKAH